MLRTFLLIGKSNDCQFECANNAWEAMEWLQSGLTADLLLLDLLEGDKSGLHILRWLLVFVQCCRLFCLVIRATSIRKKRFAWVRGPTLWNLSRSATLKWLFDNIFSRHTQLARLMCQVMMSNPLVMVSFLLE